MSAYADPALMTEMSLELTHYLLSRYRRNQTVPVSTNQPPTYWRHQEGVKTDIAAAVLRSMSTARRHLLSLSEPETTRIWCLLQLSPIRLHLISYVSRAAPASAVIGLSTIDRIGITDVAAPQLGPGITGMTAINSTCVRLRWSAPQIPNKLFGYRVS